MGDFRRVLKLNGHETKKPIFMMFFSPTDRDPCSVDRVHAGWSTGDTDTKLCRFQFRVCFVVEPLCIAGAGAVIGFSSMAMTMLTEATKIAIAQEICYGPKLL